MYPHPNSNIERRFVLSISFTLLILVAEVIGGIWTGSLALLSDAAHVFMDIFAMALSFLALRLSALPANDRYSFGYHRLEVLAALVNGVTLVIIALGIGWEAIERWQVPQPIRSTEMLVIAVVGMVVNIIVAFILGGHDHDHDHAHQAGSHTHQRDLNINSAYLHVVGDAISSVGVILAAVVITFTGWQWVDPLASLLIGGMILFSAYRVTRSALHILIEGVPEGLSISKVAATIQQTPGITDVHDLHIWNLCSKHISLSAHITVETETRSTSEETMTLVRQRLCQEFGIEHTTLQIEQTRCEHAANPCGGSLPALAVTRNK